MATLKINAAQWVKRTDTTMVLFLLCLRRRAHKNLALYWNDADKRNALADCLRTYSAVLKISTGRN